jgi:adenylosuccinate synthase
MSKVTMITDLQFGSTGKGAIAGKLSMTGEFDTVISANMPNAGHTAFDAEGNKFVHKALPSGIFSPNVKKAMLGPGAVFNPRTLEKEVDHAMHHGHLTKGAEVLVHAMSVPLTAAMKQEEENSAVAGIASTAQGSMVAQVEKMRRNVGLDVVSRDAYRPDSMLPIRVISNSEWIMAVTSGSKKILAEAAQGYSLGINQDFYPYCTSRDCTPARFLSDMALLHKSLVKVIGSMRTCPIRVGNTDKGQSGRCYNDQHEMTWDELGLVPEMTTVTGRIRRVFSFSEQQLSEALLMTGCDEIFLNFLNYLPEHEQQQFVSRVSKIAERTGCVIAYIGTGPAPSDIEMVAGVSA